MGSMERYNYLKKHHICVQCGQENAIRGQTLCFRCKANDIERKRKNYIRNRDNILPKAKRKNRERYYKLKEKHICPFCGKRKARMNKVLCDICAKKQNYKKREKYRLTVYETKSIFEIRV